MTSSGYVALSAVRREWRRVWTPPYEAPLVVLVNGLLMTGAWFLLPPDWFFRVHTAWAFPLVLAVWMLADVPATNVLGSDPSRMAAALDRPKELRRLLVAKNVVLWLLVVPVCAVVTVVDSAATQASAVTTTVSLGALVLLPPATLGIAAWLGILWPYHPMALALRWQERRRFRPIIARWATLVLLPYVVVPAIAGLIYAPVALLWYVHSGNFWSTPSESELVALLASGTLMAVLAWAGGHAVAVRLAGRRVAGLRAYLGDELAG